MLPFPKDGSFSRSLPEEYRPTPNGYRFLRHRRTGWANQVKPGGTGLPLSLPRNAHAGFTIFIA
ncbi:hypothetical protein DSO57_1025758 [Entomophthora muscae]|uniref:Uncharacterized protein n=1 Tax=Entomophthora muscae TaxID=34485 RepID=A0ACC2S4M7_9FUNG|nr:hypothetical protein DSO57_1025758 [Entomophthora muscae]